MSLVEKNDLYKTIDREYLEYLSNKCNKVLRYKQELQFKIAYYNGYPRYQNHYQNELNKLDISYCTKMNHFAHFVK